MLSKTSFMQLAQWSVLYAIAILLYGASITACAQEGGSVGASGKAPQYADAQKRNAAESLELLDKARATYERNRSVEPEDECELSGNWKFKVLAILSRAIDLDAATTLARLDSEDWHFEFKNSDMYRKWRFAVTPKWTKKAVNSLVSGSEWWPRINAYPVSWIEFEGNGGVSRQTLTGETVLARWQAGEGYVDVSLKEGRAQLLLDRAKNYFRSGEAWYYYLLLVSEDSSVSDAWGLPLVLGPRVGDCGEYNY